MRLFPAALIIVAVFLIALLFLQTRKAQVKTNLVVALPLVLLLLTAGMAFVFLGKVAFFISILVFALFLVMRSSRPR